MRFILSILIVLCLSLCAHAITPRELSDRWWPDDKKLSELPGALAHEALIYAKLSEAAYQRKMRVDDWYLVDSIDHGRGFHGSVYQKGDLSKKRDRFAIVFTGTDDLLDVVEDHMQATGHLTPQYLQAYQFAERVTWEQSPEKFIVTGHSLGGGLASYAALKLGLKAYTFNPAGLVGAWKEVLESSRGAVKADITHVVVEGYSGEKNALLKALTGPFGFLVDARGPDIVASYGQQPGRIYRVNSPKYVGMRERHSVKTVIKALEARWERTVADNSHARGTVVANREVEGKLWLSVNYNAAFKLKKVLRDANFNARKEGGDITWTRPLTKYNRKDNGRWDSPRDSGLPDSVRLKYSLSPNGIMTCTVKGGTDDEKLSVLTYGGIASWNYINKKGIRVNTNYLVGTWLKQGLRMNLLGRGLIDEYKALLNAGHVSNGPIANEDYCRLPFKFYNGFDLPIFVIYSGIYHQQRDYNWYKNEYKIIDKTRMQNWSPAPRGTWDRTMNLTRSFSLDYHGAKASYVTAMASTDNQNKSRIDLDGRLFVQRENCCGTAERRTGIFPRQVKIATKTVWSNVSPRFRMAVLASDVKATNWSESCDGKSNSSHSWDANPKPMIMKIPRGLHEIDD